MKTRRFAFTPVFALVLGEAAVTEAGILPNLREEPALHHDEIFADFGFGLIVAQPTMNWTDPSGARLTYSPYVATYRLEMSVNRDTCACPSARGVLGASIGMGDDVLLLGLQAGVLATAPILTWGQRNYGISLGAEALLDAGTLLTGNSETDEESPNGMSGSIRALVSFRFARGMSFRLHLPISHFGGEVFVPSLGMGIEVLP